MMDKDTFLTWSRHAAEWGVSYRENIEKLPVRAPLRPHAISRQLPEQAPENAEPLDKIFADFERIILPGITHWQHPRFFAYFPSNASPASVIGEYLTAALGANALLWQASPAATEMETRILGWLRQAIGLNEKFYGVIQDSASTSSLAALLVMRERASGFKANQTGLAGMARRPRVYCSAEAHSSVEKGAWISGIGAENLVKINPSGPLRAMDCAALAKQIDEDIAQGYKPAGIVATTGATAVGACDGLPEIVKIAKRHDLYLHLDAAWAGSAMICPEFRHLWQGVEGVDSLVLNPHKWLGAHFDCSAHFVKDPELLMNTLSVVPEYLRTEGAGGSISEPLPVDHSRMSIQLGRRFRALKLWFVLRAYGLSGLRQLIRSHVEWAGQLAERLGKEADFEITSAPVLSLFSFRHIPETMRGNPGAINAHNRQLLQRINDDGRIYLTGTSLDEKNVIRFQIGTFAATSRDIDCAFETICTVARNPG